jgi:chemotaxis protein CheY-P-specific phosphatase CheC
MDQTKKILTDVFGNAAESFAYMFAEPHEGVEAPPAPESALKVNMSFHGAFSGELVLLVPETLCPAIAANALGLEPEDDEAASGARDALKELLNVTCGQLLTALAGEEPVFDLTVPEVSILEEGDWEAYCAVPGSVLFSLEDEPVILQLTMAEDKTT